MIIVDTALQKRHAAGNPIRVAMVGAGFMGRGVALNIFGGVDGMELVAISNRHIDGARRAYKEAGIDNVTEISTVAELEASIEKGEYAITDNALVLCEAKGIDAVLEVTGAIEFGLEVALKTIENGKHIILMNAELDSTVGPLLKTYADKAGVVMTNVDGDQPGVIVNLFRFVKGMGIKPVLCGNIKGLQDPYRNPTTQEAFAKQWGQAPHMVTSFADGSKISFEQAIVANATGMHVAKRGMHGPTVASGTPIEKTVDLYPMEDLENGPGIVDYVVGSVPNGGIFVLGMHEHPQQQHYLNLYKVGEGPLYCFYNPYHLCHFEVHNTIARAVLFDDAAVTPLGAPIVDVVATAKIDLKAGETLDGIGWYMTYGEAENADITHSERLLPMGLAEGCVLKHDVPKDKTLTYDDVILPKGRNCDALRAEQAIRVHLQPLVGRQTGLPQRIPIRPDVRRH
ncbi:MAG TPA: NAD(P)-dependent oxidoreductase, partial [Armatimonadetes bacterium]|nr:NAD(P)-dependent oxidoreductase [Armatimonadota bacterium]